VAKMYANIEQVQMGINNFIENEIAKKAVGVNKFLTYMAIPIIDKKVTQYIENLSSNPLTKDMFDDNRNVDLDKVYNIAKGAMSKSGQFVYYGIVFNETDIDKLYTYIRG
jgi:hypothetical protein